MHKYQPRTSRDISLEFWTNCSSLSHFLIFCLRLLLTPAPSPAPAPAPQLLSVNLCPSPAPAVRAVGGTEVLITHQYQTTLYQIDIYFLYSGNKVLCSNPSLVIINVNTALITLTLQSSRIIQIMKKWIIIVTWSMTNNNQCQGWLNHFCIPSFWCQFQGE